MSEETQLCQCSCRYGNKQMGEKGITINSLSGLSGLSTAKEALETRCLHTEKRSMLFCMGPGRRPARKLSVNWRGVSDVIFSDSLGSTCSVCFSLGPFTQRGSAGSTHVWLPGKIKITALRQGERRAVLPSCVGERLLDFLEQGLLLRAAAGPGCSRMASQSLLAFAALGSSSCCSSLSLFLSFALDLPCLFVATSFSHSSLALPSF